MWPKLKPSQRLAILGVINPQSSAGVQSTGWVDASLFQNLLAVINVGAITATGLVDAKLQQATSAAGAGAKDIAGKAITQLAAATPDSNKQVLINFQQDDLDVTGGFAFVRLSITPSVAAALIGGLLLGVDPRYGPADGSAAATQAQIVG